MYFESLRVGTVTLRVFQAKKIPNNNCKPWYVKTTEKKKKPLELRTRVPAVPQYDR